MNCGGHGNPIPPAADPHGVRSTGGRKVEVAFAVVIVIMIMLMMITIIDCFEIRADRQSSTIQRQKLEDVQPYLNDCVIDELGWIRSTTQLSANLQQFYEETGMQPFIYMRAYDPELVTDEDKEAFSAQWFEDNLYEKGYTNALLYIYFAEYDQDNEIGYMVLRYGQRAGQIMDAEAVDIFWGYHDSYWDYYDEDHTDEMYVSTFNSTAETIMKISTTGRDVAKWVFIFLVVVAIGTAIVIVMVKKRQFEQERAQETERILSTSMDDLAKTQEEKDLFNKYKESTSQSNNG